MNTPRLLALIGLCLPAASLADPALVLHGGITAPYVIASEVVTTPRWEIIPDYVFSPGYPLRSLAETEAFVREHRHLPHVPGARALADSGMELSAMNLALLRTVEELTLHAIELDKRIRRLERLARRLRNPGTEEARP